MFANMNRHTNKIVPTDNYGAIKCYERYRLMMLLDVLSVLTSVTRERTELQAELHTVIQHNEKNVILLIVFLSSK